MRISTGSVAAGVLALSLIAGTSHAAVVNGSGLSMTVDCDGGDAAVNGSANQVVFHGPCRALRVVGATNQVNIALAPGGTIEIIGTANRVLYEPVTPPPVVSALGIGNVIKAGAGLPEEPAAEPTPVVPSGHSGTSTIILAGDSETNDVTCTGCDVLIHGSNSHYRLRGGVRSVTVEGHADQIQAELEPGAHIAINGDGVTLNYTLTREGLPPVVSITGNGNQVIHAS